MWDVTDPAGSGQDSAEYDLIRPESGHLAGSGQTFLPDSGNICQTLIFAFRNFFVRTKY
jgi:hypothetical protein